MIDAQTIQKLRQLTGAGMMDAKKALTDANGDENKALEILRLMGQKIAAKKQQERIAKDGLIEAYVHMNGKVAALVMLACETDFVAKNSEFKTLAHDLAMQTAAMNPLYISSDDVPEEIINQEKKIYEEELKNDQKPSEIKEKIINGKLEKYFSEICLLSQKFIKDDKQTIKNLVDSYTAKLGEKIEIKKIVRLEI
ncbi:MAG TPA: translation elongation factor Ts [bacterium]|nr:translation elongation factor Ts [bacterium]HPL95337.1 translation elongation factor Ts [bacterium]